MHRTKSHREGKAIGRHEDCTRQLNHVFYCKQWSYSYSRDSQKRGLAFVGGAAQSTALREPAEVSLQAGKYACCLVLQNLQRTHSFIPRFWGSRSRQCSWLRWPLKIQHLPKAPQDGVLKGLEEPLGFHSTVQGIFGKGRVRPDWKMNICLGLNRVSLWFCYVFLLAIPYVYTLCCDHVHSLYCISLTWNISV